MLTALSTIASAQVEPTEEIMMQCKQFLDYPTTHQAAIVTYKKSDMILVVHSCASYLSKPKAQSRASGRVFLSSNTADLTKKWGGTQHCTTNQNYNVISSRSGTRRTLHKLLRSNPAMTHSQRNGPQTTSYSHTN